MTVLQPFDPEQTAITHLAVTNASNPTALVNGRVPRNSMEIKNYGSNPAFLKFGTTAPISVAGTGICILPGEKVVYNRASDNANGLFFVDAICAGILTTSIVITLGTGGY